MKYNWFSIPYIETQENDVQAETEQFFGKNRDGFCDFALDGIELLMQGICHLTNTWELNEQKEFKDFQNAMKCFTYYHLDRIVYILKATYNLLITGYYTESAILLRHIVETFVRLRFIEKTNNIDNILFAIAGRNKYQGKKFNFSYKEQFDTIAPGLYEFYRLLCDMAHGAMASHILKSKIDSENKLIIPDNGIVFKSNEASFIINQFCVYLLAHLRFMLHIFPEIKAKMPDFYSRKLNKTISLLEELMSNISKSEKNKIWYEAVKNIVEI